MTPPDAAELASLIEREYVPHIHKEGARYHVLSWKGFYDDKGNLCVERHCSEPRCEINRPADLRLLALQGSKP